MSQVPGAGKRPSWPDSLPPPLKMIEGARHINLTTDDLVGVAAVSDLVHDIYWYQDDLFFLFFVYGEGIDSSLNEGLVAHGVSMRKTEFYFFRHPRPAYENDFIRVLPHSAALEWQREAGKGQMWGRVSLALEPWQEKQLDLQHVARAASKAAMHTEPVVEIKPSLWGISINVSSLVRRVWLNRRS